MQLISGQTERAFVLLFVVGLEVVVPFESYFGVVILIICHDDNDYFRYFGDFSALDKQAVRLY